MSVKQNYSFLRILTGSDLSKRRMPIMKIESGKPGPLLWLTACMHGDEIGGTVIIHEVFKRLRKSLVNGRVYALPLLNPFGFEMITRNISMSKEDLNRSFPGSATGTLAQRIAGMILNLITDSSADLVIDIHNDWNKSIPYVVLDSFSENNAYQKALDLSSGSGLIRIMETETITGSLTYNLLKNDIPAFVMEMGESFVINEQNILVGINSIMNILDNLGMINPTSTFQYPGIEELPQYPLRYSALPYSSSSGILRFRKGPGQIVKKGDKLAIVSNAFGKQVEAIRALNDGIVLGHSDNSLAYPGSPVMAFGVF